MLQTLLKFSPERSLLQFTRRQQKRIVGTDNVNAPNGQQ